jgi:fucose permease
VAEVFPHRRATAVSILNVTWTIGAIVCGPLVMLAEDLHMLAKFLVGIGLFHAICALLIGAWKIEPLEKGTDELDAVPAASRTRLMGPAAIVLALLFFLYVGTESAFGGWVAAYANRVESISEMMSALTPAFFWSGLMIGRALAPAVLRALAAYEKRERMLTGCGLTLATMASSALLFARTYRAALVCVTLAGLGLACVYPILVGWLVRIYGAHVRRFGSVVFATGSLGGATLPWLVGAVSTHTSALRTGLVVPIAACVAMFLLNGFFPERRKA